jgi:hypothetical protein
MGDVPLSTAAVFEELRPIQDTSGYLRAWTGLRLKPYHFCFVHGAVQRQCTLTQAVVTNKCIESP